MKWDQDAADRLLSDARQQIADLVSAETMAWAASHAQRLISIADVADRRIDVARITHDMEALEAAVGEWVAAHEAIAAAAPGVARNSQEGGGGESRVGTN